MTKNKKVLLRMRRFFTVGLLSIVLYSCKPGIPKDIIQPVAMENILFDIHVVDGYSTVLALPSMDSTKKVIAPYYKGVYKKYGVDSALYARSLDYYYKNPQLLKEMYDHLSAKLSKAKDKANAPPPSAPKPPVKPKDSAVANDRFKAVPAEIKQLPKPQIAQ